MSEFAASEDRHTRFAMLLLSVYGTMQAMVDLSGRPILAVRAPKVLVTFNTCLAAPPH
jgi:hypothetical protein